MRRPSPESISSDRANEALDFEPVRALGEKLVDEFVENDPCDTLGRWMAHYIAELIEAVDKSTPAELRFNQHECAKAILSFWDHRSIFPPGKRPFEGLEPVVETLRKLDPDSTDPFYRPPRVHERNAAIGEVETNKWLSIAEGLDYTARILVEFALKLAIMNASDKTKEWLDVSEKSEKPTKIDVQFIRMLTTDLELQQRVKDQHIESIQKKIARLSSFEDIATAVKTQLQVELDEFGKSSDDDQ